jgi:hypothetical protein
MYWGRDAKSSKNSRPFPKTLKGREYRECKRLCVQTLSHPWCHPNCLPERGSVQDAGRCKTRPLRDRQSHFFIWLLLAWEPSTRPTCLLQVLLLLTQPTKDFLRSAAHECVLRVPCHTELPLCFGSLLEVALVLFSLNAGQN